MKRWIKLVIILIIAAFLRFYQLGSNPPSLTWDEVAWGYNAYTLGVDGKDEFGRLLPYTYLESFGDFKPPLYAYLSILPIKLFGLTEFATRFASAFFGVLTVLETYFLVKLLFRSSVKQQVKNVIPSESADESRDLSQRGSSSKSPVRLLWKILRLRYRFAQDDREYIALLSAGLLAISHWHIMLSRAAFEANVATFLLVIGIWLFLLSIQKRSWFLILSIVAFSLSLYTFNSARIVAPLLVFVLALFFWRQLLAKKKATIIAILVGLLIVLPTIPFLLSPQARLRFEEVNIFTNVDIVKMSNQEISNDDNAWWSNILHNRRILFGLEFLKHYFDHLNPAFLFIGGDENPKFSLQSMGQLYLWQLPFLVIGILLFIRRREPYSWFLPVWILISFIPAGVARETPHALRIESAVVPFTILIAYGIVQGVYLLPLLWRRIPLRRSLTAGVGICMAVSVLFFVEDYFVHYPKQFSREWQYGYKEALAYISHVEKQYDMISFTQALGRPYAYTVFYHQISPETFRQQAAIHRDAFGFVTVKSVGKYYFGKEFLPKNTKGNVLYIDEPKTVPSKAKVLKTFYLLNGEPSLVAYTLE